MRLQGRLILETVNATRLSSHRLRLPLAGLEQSLRTNRPFVYDSSHRVPVFSAEYWSPDRRVRATKQLYRLMIDEPAYAGSTLLCRNWIPTKPRSCAPLYYAAAAPVAHVLISRGMFEIRTGSCSSWRRASARLGQLAEFLRTGATFFEGLITLMTAGWRVTSTLASPDGSVKKYVQNLSF